jgi:hypothetical protein
MAWVTWFFPARVFTAASWLMGHTTKKEIFDTSVRVALLSSHLFGRRIVRLAGTLTTVSWKANGCVRIAKG